MFAIFKPSQLASSRTKKFSSALEEEIPLVSSDSQSVTSFDFDADLLHQSNGKSRYYSITMISLTVFCLLTACTSTVVMLSGSQHMHTDNLSLYDLQSKVLEDTILDISRPSQFMGLEKINRTSIHELFIINFPFLVTRVDKTHPSSILTNGHTIVDGIDMRRVEVTQNVRIVATVV